MESRKMVDENIKALTKILINPSCAKLRKESDIYTRALFYAANVLPEGHEKTALLYLARNTKANIILEEGDKVITSGINKAIELMKGVK